MKKNSIILLILLTLITNSTSHAITIINESHQSFIINYEDSLGNHSVSLTPNNPNLKQFNFDITNSPQYIHTDAQTLTITIRNPYSPDGKFSEHEIDTHMQAVIAIDDIDTISIIANTEQIQWSSQVVCVFSIYNISKERPDSAIELTSPKESSTDDPSQKAKILGTICQMDLDFSTLSYPQYLARSTPRNTLEFNLQNSNSAAFD